MSLEKLKGDLAAFPAKELTVNKDNAKDVKHLLDDHIKMIMTDGLGFKESHVHADVKLFFGYTSSILALCAGYYGYKIPFYECRQEMFYAVCLYFVLYGIYLGYQYFIERDTIFVGYKKFDKQWRKVNIRANLKPGDHNYTLYFSGNALVNDKGKSITSEKTLSKSVGTWIDEKGKLSTDRYIKDVIGFLNEFNVRPM